MDTDAIWYWFNVASFWYFMVVASSAVSCYQVGGGSRRLHVWVDLSYAYYWCNSEISFLLLDILYLQTLESEVSLLVFVADVSHKSCATCCLIGSPGGWACVQINISFCRLLGVASLQAILTLLVISCWSLYSYVDLTHYGKGWASCRSWSITVLGSVLLMLKGF